VAIAGIAAKYYFFPDPERVIRKELAGLAETINKETSGNISKIANVNRIAGYFTTDVSIQVEGRYARTIQGKDEVLQLAMAARSQIRSINLSFADLHVVVDPDEESAKAHVTALVQIDNDPDLYVQELKMQLRKIDGEWLISHIEPARQPKTIP
jgi:hypothetical protein